MQARSTIVVQAAAVAAALVLVALTAGCDASAASADLLAQRGYKVDAQSTCRAAAKGDLEALRVLAQAPAARSLVLDGERFCLEGTMLGKGGKVDVGAVLGELKPAKAEFNRVYASSTGMTARDVPQADALARAAGQRAIDLYANGAVVEATPLMWAVWSGDVGAVQSMLALGADPNLASVVPVRVSGTRDGLVRILATPLFEAHRLKQTQIAQLLTKHGGAPRIAAEKPKT